MRPIYFIPHHDDEIFIIPKLRLDIDNGKSPLLIFFMSSELRAKESFQFLNRLGIPKENIILLGAEINAIDGILLSYIPFYIEKVGHIFEQQKCQFEIISPAYEGGHQDHDAISLLGRVLSKKWAISLTEFFLYNGYGTIGKFYYVSSNFTTGNKLIIKYKVKDHINLFIAPTIYRSQKVALLGLWPFLIIKSFFSQLTLNKIDQDFLEIKRHTQVPLYERWGRMTEDEFLKTVKSFSEVSSILGKL